MSKINLLIFLAIWTILFAVSCSSKPDTTWLSESPCTAPCWYGIIPGKTKVTELSHLLETNPHIDQQSITNWGSPFAEYYSDLYVFQIEDWVIGEITILGDTVSHISFSSISGPGCADWLGVTLGEMIAINGDPEKLVYLLSLGPGPLFSDAIHPIIRIIDLDRGVVYGYDAYYLPENVKDEVTQDLEINSLQFFNVDDFEVLIASGGITNVSLSYEETLARFQDWTGFGTYSENEK